MWVTDPKDLNIMEIISVTAFVKYGPTGKRSTPLPVQITCESTKRNIWENATLKEVNLDNYFIDNLGSGKPVKNLKGNKGISLSRFITESKGNKPLDGNPLNVTLCNWLPTNDNTKQLHENITSHIIDAMKNVGWKVKQLDSNVITYMSCYALVTDTTIDSVPVRFTVVLDSNIIEITANAKSRSFHLSHSLTQSCSDAIAAIKQMVLIT